MEERWNKERLYRALIERDASFEGVFWVGVKTTGIFCRPTCSARKPKTANCLFFPTVTSALHAGFRPCLRCRPLDRSTDAPEWLLRLQQRVEETPWERLRAADLAVEGLTPDRVRRQFKRHFGMSFAEYQRALAMGSALKDLREGYTVLEASARSGFDSTSGFRDAFRRLFGDPPSAKAGWTCLTAHTFDTPLGPMLSVASENGLCLLEFVDRRALAREIADLRKRFRTTILPGKTDLLDQAERELSEYFEGGRRAFNVPLDPPGGSFSRRVWNRLLEIPFGQTASYADLAEELGIPGGAQAIGRANGANAMAVIIPCHRVIRRDGQLAGYAGGLWRKEWLLEHERKVAAALEPPYSSARRLTLLSGATTALPPHLPRSRRLREGANRPE